MRVRARGMKAHERERYTLDRCSVQARFLFAPKPPPDVAPALLLSPTRATSTGGVQAGASPAAAAAAVKGPDKPDGQEEQEEREQDGSRPARIRMYIYEEVAQTRQAGGSADKEQEKGGGRRGVFDTRALRREDEDEKEGGQEDEEEGGHGRDTRGAERNRSPCSSRDMSRVASGSRGDDRRAADDATQEKVENACAGGRKSRRRKGKGKGGAEREGAGIPDEVGVARSDTSEEVPVALSRKQERARNGRR